MNMVWVPVIAAAIGAGSALLAQLLAGAISWLGEKNRLRRQLKREAYGSTIRQMLRATHLYRQAELKGVSQSDPEFRAWLADLIDATYTMTMLVTRCGKPYRATVDALTRDLEDVVIRLAATSRTAERNPDSSQRDNINDSTLVDLNSIKTQLVSVARKDL